MEDKRPTDATIAVSKVMLDAAWELGVLFDQSGSLVHLNSAAASRLLFSSHHSSTASSSSMQEGESVIAASTLLSFQSAEYQGNNPTTNKNAQLLLLSWKDVVSQVLSSQQHHHQAVFLCELLANNDEANNIEQAPPTVLSPAPSPSFQARVTALPTDNEENRHRQDEPPLLFCVFLRPIENDASPPAADAVPGMVHGMLEASIDPLLQIDDHGIIQMVNEAAVRQFGYERDEFLGRNVSMIVGGGHAANHDQYLQRYLKTGETRVMGKKRELSARRKDGTEFPMELGLAEIQHHDGQHRRFCGFVRDLTRQKQDEQELKRREEELHRREALVTGMLEASIDPLLQIDDHGIIQMVNEAAVRQFGYERDDEFLGRNISMIVGGGHAANHDKYLQRYLKTGETRVMGKKRELSARRKDGTEFPMELGLAEIQHHDGQHRCFCGFVRDLTRQKQDEQELKRREEELHRREALVTGMLEASIDPLLQIDDHGIIQMVNEAAVHQFGYERDEFLGRNISMIVGGGHAANHDKYLQRYLKTGETHVMGKKRELSARRKDLTEFPMELGLAEIQHHDGHHRRFCGFVRDLTRQKQDEQELKHREEELHRREALVTGMLEASIDPLLQIDDHGIIQMVNEAAVRQFGYERDEFLGRNISMIVGGGHAANHDQYLQRYLKTGETRVMGKKRELSARRKDGTEFPMELGLAEIQHHDGHQRFCGFVRDLTRQKQDEQELKRREAFTNSIIEAAHDALFVTDGMESIVRVNAASTELFGWSREELEGMALNQLLAPECAAEQREELKRYVKEGAPLRKKRQVKGVRKDGSQFPLLLGCSDVEGPNGKNLFALFSLDLSDHEKMLKIEIEKKASDVLLKNVLPDQIAERLKNDPTHIAEHHRSATILFADIVGFTAMSSEMEPRELVRLLNELFVMFDELVDKYDLNKIKTIGDCYMVSSVPVVEHEEHECARVCHFAMEMLDALAKFNQQHPERKLNLRIGINEGPVVAGVVGTKRFLFDLWGDSVNTASRMESTGVPGKIQVTKAVADLVNDTFVFESRGTVQVKGKGEMEAFVLTKRKKSPRFSFKFLEKQEQLRLERELLPRLPKPRDMFADLQGSVAEISASNNPITVDPRSLDILSSPEVLEILQSQRDRDSSFRDGSLPAINDNAAAESTASPAEQDEYLSDCEEMDKSWEETETSTSTCTSWEDDTALESRRMQSAGFKPAH